MPRGFTLIEFSVVLGLITILTAFSVARFMPKMDVEIIQTRVSMAQTALDAFIRQQCSLGVLNQPTDIALLNKGFISSLDALTSPVTNGTFEMSVNWNPPFSQTVRVNVGSVNKANALLQSSGASSVSGTSLVYVKTYSRYVEKSNTDEGREFKEMFEPLGGCL